LVAEGELEASSVLFTGKVEVVLVGLAVAVDIITGLLVKVEPGVGMSDAFHLEGVVVRESETGVLVFDHGVDLAVIPLLDSARADVVKSALIDGVELGEAVDDSSKDALAASHCSSVVEIAARFGEAVVVCVPSQASSGIVR